MNKSYSNLSISFGIDSGSSLTIIWTLFIGFHHHDKFVLNKAIIFLEDKN